ncbi:SpaA isopeptide-forming pilin-related protein [Clostridium sp. LIBA-8841]|uniref:SpaA isopeptide-forming pilin-related protein n=1 Tax=Clostridium sp. LIBA-8841 TaxID=2987530 RepID=UPI002AC7D07A|nr:SpaA isopeptide-forming pilin-related protein [Clostridium sp. LIBA-8841]MDZ5255304.1 SpaA isopeptide-forming pilin-related protein [Clostridium sp. LIBA-8841]
MRERKRKIFITAMTVFITMFMNILSPAMAALAATPGVDMNITSNKSTVKDGEQVEFKLEYKVVNGGKINPGDKIIFTLPECFTNIIPEYPPEHFSSVETKKVNGQTQVILTFSEGSSTGIGGYLDILATPKNIEKPTNERVTVEFNGTTKYVDVEVTPGDNPSKPDPAGQEDLLKRVTNASGYDGYENGILVNNINKPVVNKIVNYSIYFNGKYKVMNNAVLRDNMPDGMVLKTDSVKIYETPYGQAEREVTSKFQGKIWAYQNSLVIDFGNTYSAYRVEYSTQITKDMPSYKNTVTVGSLESSTIVKPKEDSTMLTKRSLDPTTQTDIEYTSMGREVRYALDINPNNKQLNNAVFIDKFPEGMTLVDGSISVGEKSADGTFKWLNQEGLVSVKDNTMTINFGNTDKYYYLYYTLKVVEPNKTYDNSAKLTYNNTSASIDKTVQYKTNAGAINAQKTVDKETIKKGDNNIVNYTINFDCYGFFDKGYLNVVDSLDPRVKIIGVEAPEHFSYKIENNKVTVTNDIKDVEYGENLKVNIKADFSNVPDGNTVKNVATINGTPSNEVETKKGFAFEAKKIDENTGKALEGAKFKLLDSNKKELTNEDGSPIILTSDSEGKITHDIDDVGTYYLKEIVAPKGYNLNPNEIKFEVLDTDIGTILDLGNINNSMIKGGIKITKVDSQNNNPLEGAEFTVKNSEEKVVSTGTTNKDGIVEFNDLPYGSYTYKETKAPEGYILDSTPVKFDIVENNKILEFTAKNNMIHGGVKITKVDSQNNNLLEGAEFIVKNSDGKVVQTESTNKDGIVEFNNLPYGSYTYEELKAPEGYVLDSTSVKFDINENNKILEFMAKNDPIQGNLQITKVDSETGNTLPGAKFEIKDSNGKVVQTVVTDEQGVATISGLGYGQYTFQEIEAPKGYILNSNPVQFNVTEHGKTLEFTAKNNIIKGGVKITKVDSQNNKLLEGAEFTVKDSDGKVVQTGTTNKDGIVEFNKLPYGSYTYEETKAPEGYVLDSTAVKFNINENNKVLEFTANNKIVQGGIKITKIDSQNNNLLEGAEFVVKNSDGEVVQTGTTNKDGIVEFNNLPYGSYTYEETKAPEGYVLDSTAVKFDINENNKVLEFTAKNNIIKTHVAIKKSDLDDKLKLLKGATFNIVDLSNNKIVDTVTTDDSGRAWLDLAPGKYKAVEIKAPTGYLLSGEEQEFEIKLGQTTQIDLTFYNKKDQCEVNITKIDLANINIKLSGAKFKIVNILNNNVEGILVTNENGVASLKLPPGTYKLIEIEAPTGYVNSNIEKEFTVKSGYSTPINIQVTNKKISGGIKITKIDSQNNNPLEGAEFVVKNSDGEVVQTGTTNKDGIVEFNNLQYGIYTYEEVKAPEGHVLDSTSVKFDISENNKVLEFSAKNDPIEGNLQITKVDSETGNTLPGAKFEIKDSNGKVVQTVVTDEQGVATVLGLGYGQYTFQEVEAPKGYVLNSEPVQFNVEEHGKTLEFIAKNDMIQGGVKITKIDSQNNNPLEGAEFVVKSSDGKVVQTGTTNKDGIVEFNNLPYGNYTYEETKAPEGYVLDSTAMKFDISENNKVLEFTAKNNMIHGGVKITKVDSQNNNPLEGAEFVVKNSDGKVVQTGTTNKEGIVEFNNLPYGSYTYEEVKAPEGYVLDSTSVKFDISENNKVLEFTAKNNLIQGGVKITKIDSQNNNPLEGAEFVVKNLDGKVVQTGTTNKEGIVEFNNLPYGNYTYEEVKAPEGYVLDSTPVKFDIAENNKLLEFVAKNTKENKSEDKTEISNGNNNNSNNNNNPKGNNDNKQENIKEIPKTGSFLSERSIFILGLGLIIISLVAAVLVNRKKVR